MRAATYVRLSASRLGEDAPGLDRQRESTERLIREREWELVGRYQDADISAWRPGVPRPGFGDLRAAVDRGEVQAVVVWQLSRAFRRLAEGVEFLQLCRDRGAIFVSASEGLDTSTPFGPAIFALFLAMADIESGTRSERITEWHGQRAEQGLPSGGGTRSYGFKADGIGHELAEAREIRKAARYLLGGGSLRSLWEEWNQRGIRTPPFRRNRVEYPNGGRWSKSSLRRLLTSPRIAGLREHGGATYQAAWKPIISETDHLQLRALFEGRGREAAGRRYLLTGGLAVCGLCGAALVARPKDGGRRQYVCARDNRGCGKIASLAAPLEEYVSEESNREWERRQMEAPPEPIRVEEEELRRQLAADTAAIEELARARFVARSLSEAEFRAARDPLAERIADAQERLANVGRSRRTFLQNLDELPPAPWEAEPGTDPADIEEWRAWLAEVVERVVVGPAVRGRNRFSPDRVEVVLR